MPASHRSIRSVARPGNGVRCGPFLAASVLAARTALTIPTGWFGSANSRRAVVLSRPMDTHAAARMLTAAGADEALAVAVADVGGRRR